MTKDAQDPKLKVKTTVDALGDFLGGIRDPIIEASTAAVILFFLRPLLPSIGTWVVIILIVIVGVVIVAMTLSLVLWKEANKTLRTVRSDNPSLNPET